MTNSLTYFRDPATLTQQALVGKAELIPDPTAPFWGAGNADAAGNTNGIFNGLNYVHGFEVINTTASTISLAVYRSKLVISGSMTATLPNGLFDGQKKLIVVESAASTPALTMTITTPDTTTGWVACATPQFDTTQQWVEYIWTVNATNVTGAWRVNAIHRAGICAVVVGTTVLTNNVMSAIYQLSVTGTVSSTGTKAIPAGQCAGEAIHVSTPTAASTPSGTINIAGTTIATGVAATALAGINATSVQASFVWDPTNSWQNTALATATYS